MQFLPLFSKKLSSLRSSHNLTFSDLALMLNQNNTAVIKKWVAQKNWPSMEVMILLSRLFGVSIDWLLDNSDSPYYEELISSLENELITSQVHFGNSKITLFNPLGFPEIYYNPQLRKENYSLAVRANLIFLMVHEAMYQSYAYYHTHSYSQLPTVNLKVTFYNQYADKEIWLKAKERHERYLAHYLKLLYEGKAAVPIFDISK